MRQKVYLPTVSQLKIMFMEIPINNKNVYSIPIEPNKLFWNLRNYSVNQKLLWIMLAYLVLSKSIVHIVRPWQID